MTAAPSFITVVTGLPRSGTSMMMQMLAAGGHPCLTETIAHEDVLKIPQKVARWISQFLGGSLDEQEMAAVVDSRLYRQQRDSLPESSSGES
jgi:hypothetical protein